MKLCTLELAIIAKCLKAYLGALYTFKLSFSISQKFKISLHCFPCLPSYTKINPVLRPCLCPLPLFGKFSYFQIS